MEHKWNMIKRLALLFILMIAMTITIDPVLALIHTKTPSIINQFINGFDPTGDLIIQKSIVDIQGNPYTLSSQTPAENITFPFTVDLGTDHANATFGSYTTDAEGKLVVSVEANHTVTIPDIPAGTVTTVTEHRINDYFIIPDLEPITIHRGDNVMEVSNTYFPSAAMLTINGTKVLEGRPWQEGDSFCFVLEKYENGEWTIVSEETVTYQTTELPDQENPENMVITPVKGFDHFGWEVPLEETGTHIFRVSENSENSISGILYDVQHKRFQVTVTDKNIDGKLEIQTVESLSEDVQAGLKSVDVVFQNIYTSVSSDTVTIDISKTLKDNFGNTMDPSGFTFLLCDRWGSVLQTSDPTDAAGNTTIYLTYETKDAGRSFFYTLKEKVDADKQNKGMTYDASVYNIQVDVAEADDGSICADIHFWEESQPQPTAKEVPPALNEEESNPTDDSDSTEEFDTTEELDVSDDLNEDQLSTDPAQKIEDTSDTSLVLTNDESSTSINDLVEPITDDGMDESNADNDSIDEPDADDDGIIEPKKEAIKTVSTVFNNHFTREAVKWTLEGEKHLLGRPLREGEFTFELYRTSGGIIIPEGTSASYSSTNTVESNNKGRFQFDMTFTAPGTYYYVAKENSSANLGGIEYDQTLYQICIDIEDINGMLSIKKITIEDEDGKTVQNNFLTFNNTYKARPFVLWINGKKVLQDGILKPKDFTFQLYEASYLTSYGFEKGELFDRVTNEQDQDGSTDKFTFPIEFINSGTFYYLVSELNDGRQDITFDTTQYGIEVIVKDNLCGSLYVSEITITNLTTNAVKKIQNPTEEDKMLDFGIIFTNVMKQKPTEPTQPQDPTTPTTKPTEPVTSPVQKLPQTGQLWWPAPVLLLIGIVFIMVAILPEKKNKQDNDK